MYQTSDETEIWKILKYADDKGYMMACGVSVETQREQDELAENGLVNGHAYSLINCATVQGSDGRMANIVQVRNPWGSFEWNGDWGDNSELWTPQARQAIGQTNDANDGVFCMAIQDF